MSQPQIFILSSDEPLLKNDKSQVILDKAHKDLPGANLLIFSSTDFQSSGKANLKALENELIDPGLFGGDRIIKIYLNDLNQTALEVLLLIAQKIRQGVYIIVDLPRILSNLAKVSAKEYSPQKGKSLNAEKVFAYLKYKNAQIEISYPPQDKKLYMWVNERSRKYNVSLTPEACEYFAKSCEGNLTLIDQTLKILSLNPQNHSLSLNEAAAVLNADSRFQNLELGEALLSGDGQRALMILNAALVSIGNKEMTLMSITSALDKQLYGVAKLREDKKVFKNYIEKAQYFAALNLKSPKSMDACIKAAQMMPLKLYDYLIKSLSEASYALSSHDCEKAILSLSSMCVCVNNFDVMNLKPL